MLTGTSLHTRRSTENEHDISNSWKLITSSAWKNSMNSAIGGVGMLLSPQAYKALNMIESISPRIIIATFNGNPMSTIISCYSPTNVHDEEEVEKFYDDLSSVTRQLPKHNVLVLGGDFNAHLGQSEEHKFTYHLSTNRNGTMLQTFMKENNLVCLNTALQKRKGQLWTYTSPKGLNAQLDYLIINRKWRNSAMNCRAYNTFEGVYSDHRIVTAKIRLSLRANKFKSSCNPSYDWSTLRKATQERDSFILTLRNRFDALQEESEIVSPNSTFINFESACKDAASENIPVKTKMKKRTPWETKKISNTRKELKKIAEVKNANPSLANAEKLKAARNKLNEAYEKEQIDYLKTKIDQITNASTNKKSAEAWKTVNEISGRKNTNRAKLRASSQEDRLKLWKQHFQDLLGKPPTIKDARITPIFTEELNIKKGNFTMDELNLAIKNISNGKASGLDCIPGEVWKLGAFDDVLLELCNAVYNGSPIDRWIEGCLLPFPKKGDLGITKNYRGITLTSIAAKIYNAMLLNRIRPQIDPILRKNQNGFRTNRSTTGQILTIRRIIEGVKEKNLPAVLLFIDFSKAFDSIHRKKMEEILLAYGIPGETVEAIMMLYRNTKSMVRSPDGDTEFFNITAGVLQGDTLAPYLFVICLDYVLRKALDLNKQLGFTLTKSRSRRYPATKITDADYADDLAIAADYLIDASILLHEIEAAASEIGLYINAGKTKFISFNQHHSGTIKSLSKENIKAVQDYTYLGSNIASTKKDVQVRLAKAWAALNKLDKIWKSSLPTDLKRNFFRAAVESVLVYGATTWTLTSTLEKTIDGAYTRMLRAALNISWKQHPTKKELYGNIPPISVTIRDRRQRFAGHCWRSKDELASDLLLWQPKHGKKSVGRPCKTYRDQLAEDTGCLPQDLPTLMTDRIIWRERVQECRVRSTR